MRDCKERMLTYALLAAPNTIINVRACYEQFLMWFDSIGCQPTHLGVEGQGFTRKLLSFSRMSARISGASWTNITGLTLISSPPKADRPLFDYVAYADVLGNSRALTLSTTGKLLQSLDAWVGVVAKLKEAITPAYGYAYESPRSFGAALDTGGLSFSDLDILLSNEIDVEREEYESHPPMHWLTVALERANSPSIRYALRSVYAWQLLTKYQLGLKVRPGQTLQQWIETGRGRGKLAAIDRGAWVWTLPSQHQVESARAALYRAGLLWAWWPMDEPEPDENRVLPPAGAL